MLQKNSPAGVFVSKEHFFHSDPCPYIPRDQHEEEITPGGEQFNRVILLHLFQFEQQTDDFMVLINAVHNPFSYSNRIALHIFKTDYGRGGYKKVSARRRFRAETETFF